VGVLCATDQGEESDLIQKFICKVNSKVDNKTALFKGMSDSMKIYFNIEEVSDINDTVLNRLFNAIVEIQ